MTAFLDAVVGTLGHARRRRWCDAYIRHILPDGHQKSVEPMGGRLRTIERGGEDHEQALPQFLNQSPWDAAAARDGLQGWAARRFGPAGVVIPADTGFPKQGTHPVGVARPYPGTPGKVARCQVALALRFATAEGVVGRDAPGYLPEAWADDGDRRARAGAKSPSVKEWAVGRGADFRAVAGGKGPRGGRPAGSRPGRVRPAHPLSSGREPGAACWLSAEGPTRAKGPTKYFFSSLPPATSLKRWVGTAKSRWWAEHRYREWKDEPGLGHFERRPWRGWSHHAVLVPMAYAFLHDLRRTRRKKVLPG